MTFAHSSTQPCHHTSHGHHHLSTFQSVRLPCASCLSVFLSETVQLRTFLNSADNFFISLSFSFFVVVFVCYIFPCCYSCRQVVAVSKQHSFATHSIICFGSPTDRHDTHIHTVYRLVADANGEMLVPPLTPFFPSLPSLSLPFSLPR